MSLETVRALVESEDFAAKVGMASGRESFMDALEGSGPFHYLLAFLRSETRNVERITKLIQALSDQKIDYRYQNPNDAALAAYMRALRLVSPETARIAGAFVLNAPNMWWSRVIADQVLSETNAPKSLSNVTNVTMMDWLTSVPVRALVIPFSNALQSTLITNFLGSEQWQLAIVSILSFKASSSAPAPEPTEPQGSTVEWTTNAFVQECAA